MSHAIFERFLIDDSEEVNGTFAPPFDLLVEASGRDDSQSVMGVSEKTRGPGSGPRGLSIESLVEPSGLEPRTALPSNRAESTAAQPQSGRSGKWSQAGSNR